MKKIFNEGHLLSSLGYNKKVFPKSEMYEALRFMVQAKHFGLLDTFKLMVRNCENEELFATETYLNQTLMREK